MKRLRSTNAKNAKVPGRKKWKYLAGLLGAGLMVAPVRPALAQSPTESQSSGPSFEAGATAGLLGFYPTFGARVTTVFSPRFALEGGAELQPLVLDDRGGPHLLFQGQVRHSFRQGLRGNWHATYGVTFFARYEYRRASVSPGPDGSPVVVPEQRSFELDDIAIHAGIGGERRLSPQVAVRWDLQALQAVRDPTYPWPRATIAVTWK